MIFPNDSCWWKISRPKRYEEVSLLCNLYEEHSSPTFGLTLSSMSIHKPLVRHKFFPRRRYFISLCCDNSPYISSVKTFFQHSYSPVVAHLSWNRKLPKSETVDTNLTTVSFGSKRNSLKFIFMQLFTYDSNETERNSNNSSRSYDFLSNLHFLSFTFVKWCNSRYAYGIKSNIFTDRICAIYGDIYMKMWIAANESQLLNDIEHQQRSRTSFEVFYYYSFLSCG